MIHNFVHYEVSRANGVTAMDINRKKTNITGQLSHCYITVL